MSYKYILTNQQNKKKYNFSALYSVQISHVVNFKTKEENASTPVFKEKWKEELEHWFNSIEPKIEKDENDDEIYHVDPVILVKWNEAGLTQRGIIKANVIAVITGTNPAIRQYIDPDFVAPGNPGNQQGLVVSDSIFCIDAGNRSHQIYLHVIRRLQAAYLQNSAPGAPSLGRVFWVTSPRANTLQIDETYNVFTF
ncbi:unnamed protein product [Rhizophagus irregularis]|nr:unnamed protein product [Rhizophagus irregularis]